MGAQDGTAAQPGGRQDIDAAAGPRLRWVPAVTAAQLKQIDSQDTALIVRGNRFDAIAEEDEEEGEESAPKPEFAPPGPLKVSRPCLLPQPTLPQPATAKPTQTASAPGRLYTWRIDLTQTSGCMSCATAHMSRRGVLGGLVPRPVEAVSVDTHAQAVAAGRHRPPRQGAHHRTDARSDPARSGIIKAAQVSSR